jgi:hypothetical protein
LRSSGVVEMGMTYRVRKISVPGMDPVRGAHEAIIK